MKTYRVKHDAWIYGKFYFQGDTIKLTPKQAKYELLSGTIEDAA